MSFALKILTAIFITCTCAVAQSDDLTDARHEQLWLSVRDSNDPELLSLFIGGFPASPFRAEAQAALQAINPDQAALSDITTPTAPDTTVNVRFSGKLTTGAPEILGKTINQVILSSPKFPPLEGLPEELWKKQLCQSCHNWTPARMCEQAKTYVDRSDADVSAKRHPFGGSFKVNLKYWAMDGCQ